MNFKQHQKLFNVVQELADESINDPRNEDDFDTWTYGTEPLPYDHTWTSNSIKTNSIEVK